MANLISKLLDVDFPQPKKSNFNNSYDLITTNDIGFFTPVLSDHLMANTNVDLDIETTSFTNPTIAPLYGRYKVKYLAFWAPDRLYSRKMADGSKFGPDTDIYYPVLDIPNPSPYLIALREVINAPNTTDPLPHADLTLVRRPNGNFDVGVSPYEEVNANFIKHTPMYVAPSSLASYLGVYPAFTTNVAFGGFNGDGSLKSIPEASNAYALLAFWDVYRNYIVNVQETTFPVRTLAFVSDFESRVVRAGSSVSTVESNPSAVKYLLCMRENLDGFFDQVKSSYGAFNVCTTFQNYVGFNPIWSPKWVYVPSSSTIVPPASDKFMSFFLGREINAETFDPSIWDIHHNYHYGQPLCPHVPDMFTSWISNENVMLERRTARVNVEDGSFTMEQWKLASRMQNFVRKSLFKQSDFAEFIDVHFGVSPSTGITKPMFLGAFVSDVIFDDVINFSQSSDVPEVGNRGQLGARAAYGKNVGGDYNNFVKFLTKEPGTLQIYQIIQPDVFYFEGRDVQFQVNQFNEEFFPEFDAIGMQDLEAQTLNFVPDLALDDMGRFSTANRDFDEYNMAVAQHPAWIEHMTKVNKLSGQMVLPNYYKHYSLSRSYNRDRLYKARFGEIPEESITYPSLDDYTSYIYPEQFNDIFANNQNVDNFQFYLKFKYRKYQPMSKQFLSFNS